ncbi:hypothetical protein [Microbacterium sp. zg-YB36]|uniref:hypothetical protein n=1 Tax=Microbacterium sp. zg-YB36 TaxID=2969407 RepID=UPI00214B326F|nr:hypothetical protein [Microbacterium sp. zg-YB36]MDL5351112.1 hypothetical protein [Microbacterium sp. zg-YB36]
MKDIWDSLVRTLIPIAVGAVLGGFTAAGIPVDPAFEPSLIAGLTAASSAVYYAIVRLLEVYVSPKFGWLLGLAKAPVYQGAAN